MRRETDRIEQALSCWEGFIQAIAEPLGRGLINETFKVRADRGDFVLQRVNPIFDAAIHHNIKAVTEHLGRLGLPTPALLSARDGRPWAEPAGGGVWRLMTLVPGVGFDVVQSPAQAQAGGQLVGRFHQALDTLEHRFVALRSGVHDTPRHLRTLEQAVADTVEHRLHREVSELAAAIAAAARELPPLGSQPGRICHGDLKLNNLLFRGSAPPESEQAVCLIDLDTVGPGSLAYELGDAWRSWCNRSGEDQTEASFDVAIFAASWQGYRAACGRQLSEPERRGLLLGVEWVSLELAARFAADALLESYFAFDAQRFAAAGEHNLLRSRGQWSLLRALGRTRPERAELLGLSAP